jgi:hypothetical protein
MNNAHFVPVLALNSSARLSPLIEEELKGKEALRIPPVFQLKNNFSARNDEADDEEEDSSDETDEGSNWSSSDSSSIYHSKTVESVSAIQYHAILGYLPLPTSLSPKKHRFHWN